MDAERRLGQRCVGMLDQGSIVCVTGASGYIGTHVVRRLIDRGVRVRATVRNPSDTAKTAHLEALGDLEIYAADLDRPGSFDRAIAGCTHVVHAASPVMLSAQDPDRDIIAPAIQGTRTVLEAVVKAGTVRRVVQTSSIAAVYDYARPEDYVFTEADWNESAAAETTLPYPHSKVLAERAAVDFRNGLPASEQFELTSIQPTFVLGPVDSRLHLRTSPNLVSEILTGRVPAIPNFYFNLVDVRDVADAHIRALEHPYDSLEPRYICYAEQLHFREVCDRLRAAFPDRRIPRWSIPGPLMYAYALFDKRLTWAYLRRSLGRQIRIDNRRAQKSLGVSFRPIDETIADTAQSMVDHGFVR